MAIAYCTKND